MSFKYVIPRYWYPDTGEWKGEGRMEETKDNDENGKRYGEAAVSTWLLCNLRMDEKGETA